MLSVWGFSLTLDDAVDHIILLLDQLRLQLPLCVSSLKGMGNIAIGKERSLPLLN